MREVPVGLNWSAGFAGAAQGLGQAVQVTAQQQLEDMKDQRAENLARLQFKWHEQHDANMQAKQAQHDLDIEKMRGELQDKQIKATTDLTAQHEKANIELLTSREAAAAKAQAAALKASDDRQDARLSQAEKIAQRRDQESIFNQWQQSTRELDEKEAKLTAELQRGASNNITFSMITDPVAKAKAIANDPTLGPIADELAGIKMERAKAGAGFSLRLKQSGHPLFQGVSLPGDPNDTSRSADGSSNLLPNANGDPTAGMLAAPTVGPTPDPVTSNLGPAKPSLIPFGPGMNTGADSNAPNSAAQPPSLIQ
jgi:hypothetical protein